MKFDLVIDPPYLNAPGTLGFTPNGHGPVVLSQLGAFVTNPISREPRTPANGKRFVAYPGGFLLHTGHPNPGLRTALRRYAPQWERSPVPVLVHLLIQRLEEATMMVQRSEGQPGVAGLELGLPPDIRPGEVVALARELSGELPVVLRLPLERAAELSEALAAAKVTGRLAAVSLGAPRGVLPLPGSPLPGELRSGRLYGPAVFPLALAALQAVRKTGLPVIAGGGVYRKEQAQAMLAAGALAVQLDAVLWRDSETGR